MSTRHQLIWPNITIGVNVIFDELLPLTGVGHTVSTKSHCAVKTVVISNVHMSIIRDNLYCLENGIFMPTAQTGYTDKYQPTRELLSQYHHLSRNTCPKYIQKPILQDHYVKNISISIFQDHKMKRVLFYFFKDHFLTQSYLCPCSTSSFQFGQTYTSWLWYSATTKNVNTDKSKKKQDFSYI